MIEARFTNEMRTVLKKLKGTEFISYSASELCLDKTIYDGIIIIQTSKQTIRVSNKEMSIPWFGDKDLSNVEDIFVFHCEEILEEQEKAVVFVNEKIEEIELITDYVKIPKKEYEIAMDMALVIRTSSHRYIISRGWHFGEYLDFNIDKNYDEIYPVKQIIEEWNNFEEWEVIVERVIERL